MRTERQTDKERNGARQITNMYIKNFQQAKVQDDMVLRGDATKLTQKS